MKKLINTLVLSVSLLSAPALLAEMVNINQASAEVLQENLKGVGEKKAAAIVAYRNAHGAFKTLEELTEVKGIGEAILSKNKADLSLDEGITKLTGKAGAKGKADNMADGGAGEEVSATSATPTTSAPDAKINKSEPVKKDKAADKS